jgi:hypothetical protein
MYIQIKTYEEIKYVRDLTNNLTIPLFDPANTDYQTFKTDVAGGVPLEDPDGNVMTQEQVAEFLKALP